MHFVVHKQDKQLTYLGTVVIHAGQDVVHEVESPSRLVGKNEACTHNRDLRVLNLQHWSKYCRCHDTPQFSEAAVTCKPIKHTRSAVLRRHADTLHSMTDAADETHV